MHPERHRTHRVGWLRAAVLGANDGIVSTASLMVGVAAAEASHSDILTAGVAGLVAGAMSMAAGEYVSVSSQADAEKADLARERRELETAPAAEQRELARIYTDRGLDPDLADRVATQLMEHDAIGAHARDELGLTEDARARPTQAAFTSAVAFAAGAALPLGTAALAPRSLLLAIVAAASLLSLTGLGALSSRLGGSPVWKGMARITLWSAVAMAATAAVGRLFGTVV